jgi:putative glycosyltransferase (TIGR04372 family)
MASKTFFCLRKAALFAVGAVVWFFCRLSRVKIFVIQADRVGGLVIQCETFLRKKKLKKVSRMYRYFYVSSSIISNQFLFDKYNNEMTIRRSDFLYRFFLVIQQSFPSIFYIDPRSEKSYFEFNNTEPSIFFSEEEVYKGNFILQKLGINCERDKFICLFSRDSAYLKKVYPGTDWSYHNYRNLDIDVFEESVKLLVDKGYYVVRVGNIVEKPISFKHRNVVDYPYTNYVSDFMDIFLMAHCTFVLGTESGCTDVAKVFNTPSLIVNYSVINRAPWGSGSLYAPVTFRSKETGEKLSYQEIIEKKGFEIFKTRNISDKGLAIIKNTRDEILDLVREMLLRLDGVFEYEQHEKEMMSSFMVNFRAKFFTSDVKTPIGVKFLKNNLRQFLPIKQAVYFEKIFG